MFVDLIKSGSLMEISDYNNSSLTSKLITIDEFKQVVGSVEVICQNPVRFYEFKKKLGSGGMCQVF